MKISILKITDSFRKGTRGWLCNFLNRYDLVLRRITAKGKQLPLNTKNIIAEFVEKCKRKNSGLKPSQIWNMDQKNCQLDSTGNFIAGFIRAEFL